MMKIARGCLLAAMAAGTACGGHRMQVGQPVDVEDADPIGRQAAQLGAAQLSCPEENVTVTLLGASTYRVTGCGGANDYLCGIQPGRWHREVLCSLQATSGGTPVSVPAAQ